MIFATLAACKGVKNHTASMLGVSLKTLYNRLEYYRARELPSRCRRLPGAGRTASPLNHC